MPNWCDNNLMITGSYEELKRFYETAKGRGILWDTDGVRKVTETKHIRKDADGNDVEFDIPIESLDFSNFMFPVAINGTFHDVGYSWCCDNWGTKWNACDSHCDWDDNPAVQTGEEKTDELFYYFNTAWSPMSEELINCMQGMFPKLKFSTTFYEGGIGFYGGYNEEDGYLLHDIPSGSDMEDLFDRLLSAGYFNAEECSEEYRSDCVCDLYYKFEDMVVDSNEAKDADDLYDYCIKEMQWEQSKKKGEDLYAGNETN
jgi:hypothetical protein